MWEKKPWRGIKRQRKNAIHHLFILVLNLSRQVQFRKRRYIKILLERKRKEITKLDFFYPKDNFKHLPLK